MSGSTVDYLVNPAHLVPIFPLASFTSLIHHKRNMKEHKKNHFPFFFRTTGGSTGTRLSSLYSSRALQVFLILLTVYAIYSSIITQYKKKFGENISSFICMGTEFMEPAEMPQGMFYFEQSRGYDGQFFYFIANDPFIKGDMYKRIDVPAYRYQRILYPLLAHLAANGNVQRIPKMLVRINLYAILLGTLFIILMLMDQKLNPWYALFYPLLSGLLLTLLRDLAGPVTMACTVGGFYFYHHKRYVISMILISAAILSREIMIALIPVLIIDSLFLKKQTKIAVMSTLPLIPFAIWQWYIFFKLHIPSWYGGRRNLGRPLTAMISHLRETVTTPDKTWEERTILVLFVTVTFLGLTLAIREVVRARNVTSLSFLGYSIMPFIMTSTIWIEPWSYCRVFLPSAVLMLLGFMQSKDRLYLIPLSLYTAIFPVTLAWLGIIGT